MKKDILILYAVLLWMTLFNVSEINAVDRNVAYWRQKLVDASVPDLQKTLYADSILMTGVADSLDVTLTLAELLTKVGRYGRAAEVRKAMLKYDDTLLPKDKKLTIRADLARDLINQEDFIGAINICNKILQRSDSESGLLEEMEAYRVMHYIFTRISHKDSHKYLDLGNNLLAKARKANYSEREIGDLQRVVVRMRLSEHISKKKFNEFFRLADSIMAQPMSNTQRLQLDLLWAYAKIVNGEDDLAMEKYREIVGKPLWNVRQGEALLNLTHLLEKHKRYEEALDLIQSKKDIISLIPRPSYIYIRLFRLIRQLQ